MSKEHEYLEFRFFWLRVAAVGKSAFRTLVILTIILGIEVIIGRVLGLW